jgi:hypothetical protein
MARVPPVRKPTPVTSRSCNNTTPIRVDCTSLISQLTNNTIARIASTMLIGSQDKKRGREAARTNLQRVTINKSPRRTPKYAIICVPPYCRIDSRGMRATKDTGWHIRTSSPLKRGRQLTSESGLVGPVKEMTNPRQRYKHEEDVEPCCGQPSCSKAGLGVGHNVQDCFNVATRLSRIVGTRLRCFPRALWKKLCAGLCLVTSVAFFSTSSLVELLLVVWLFRAVLPTFLAVRVCLGSADMVR